MGRELLIGVIGGLIVLVIVKALDLFQKRSIQSDIEFLEFEKKHLEEMKRSSIEMNRSSFRALFSLLFLVGLANLIPPFLGLVEPPFESGLNNLLTATVWVVFLGLSIRFFRRYDNLKNYAEAMAKMEEKLGKLKEKLNG